MVGVNGASLVKSLFAATLSPFLKELCLECHRGIGLTGVSALCPKSSAAFLTPPMCTPTAAAACMIS